MNDSRGDRDVQPSSFGKNEDGSVSAEFVIWVPILTIIILLVADVTAAFTTQASMWRSASEIGRGLATGRLAPDQVQQVTEFTLGALPSFDVDGYVTVDLVRDYSEIGTGFLLPPLGTMRVQLRHMVEPHVLDQY